MPQRATARLRWGRVSLPEARYFVTACTQDRVPIFAEPAPAQVAASTLMSLHVAGDFTLGAAIVQPDHLHLLFTLGSRLELGQVIGKAKALIRRGCGQRLVWQNDGYEHRLRPAESSESVAFYIFMNPYRAGLIPLTERSPWWCCPDPKRFHFLSLIEEDQPIPKEWNEKSISYGSSLRRR